MESHLLQMRGLKHPTHRAVRHPNTSHLLQMRGLKLLFLNGISFTLVASFTDAWIETFTQYKDALDRGGRIFYRCVD